MHASTPSGPSSLPWPDQLDPAERGIGAADHVAELIPTMPDSISARDDLLAPRVAGPGVGGEAVGQAVGLGDHLVVAA